MSKRINNLQEGCTHKNNENNLDLSIFEGYINCRRCAINFGKIVKPVEYFNKHDYREGVIEIRTRFYQFLEEFKKASILNKFKIFICEDGYIDEKGFIGLPENMEKKSSGIDQAFIINNQASKISDLENELKRLKEIIINQAELIGKKYRDNN